MIWGSTSSEPSRGMRSTTCTRWERHGGGRSSKASYSNAWRWYSDPLLDPTVTSLSLAPCRELHREARCVALEPARKCRWILDGPDSGDSKLSCTDSCDVKAEGQA